MTTEKKDFVIRFRLTGEEKEQILEQMKSENFDTVSSFLRHRTFKKPMVGFPQSEEKRPNVSAEISELLRMEIKRIGQNINQVVKKANGTYGSSDLRNLLEKILVRQQQIITYLDLTNQNLNNLN